MRAVFRIVDVETTGLDSKTDRIVELAYRDVRYYEGLATVLDTSTTLCDPGIPIPPVARAAHHISNRMVVGKPSPETAIIPLFKPRATLEEEGFAFVAHNAPFDRGFCEAAFGGPTPLPWIDTCRLAKHVWKDAPGYGNAALFYWRFPELELSETHRAQTDAAITEAVLLSLLEAVDTYVVDGKPPITRPHELAAFAEEPLDISDKPMGFGKHETRTWRQVRGEDVSYLHWMVREDTKSQKEKGVPAWDRDQWHTIHLLLGWRSPPMNGRR